MTEAVGEFDKKRVDVIGAAIEKPPRRMSAKIAPVQQRRVASAEKGARSRQSRTNSDPFGTFYARPSAIGRSCYAAPRQGIGSP